MEVKPFMFGHKLGAYVLTTVLCVYRRTKDRKKRDKDRRNKAKMNAKNKKKKKNTKKKK